MHYQEITTAIEVAMEDLIENQHPTPHDPVIARDAGGYYYGSRLTADAGRDQVIYDAASGFGSWTPDAPEDIPDCAVGLASEISAGQRSPGWDA